MRVILFSIFFLVAVMRVAVLPVQAASPAGKDFVATALSSDDKNKIEQAFKPLESKWVPAEELAKNPGIYWQDDWQKQSFHIKSKQKGIEDVYFVPIAANFEQGNKSDQPWNESLSLLIINASNLSIRPLPAHPATNWAVYDVAAVAFRDVRGDGNKAIIVDARAVSGAGPSGADPFDVFAIYLPANDGTWGLDAGVQKRIEHAHTIAQAIKAARAYFAQKHE